MNRNAVKSVKKKHRSWAKYRRSGEYIDCLYYCRDRNAATRNCRNARREFEKKLGQRKVVQKSFYRYVNSMRKVKVNVADLKREERIQI